MSSFISIVSGENDVSGPLSSGRLDLPNADCLQLLANLNNKSRLFYSAKNSVIKSSLYKLSILFFLLFFSFIVGVFGQFAGGNGSVLDPYQISNWEQLSKINQKPNAFFVLISDLDALAPGYAAFAGPQANSGKGWQAVANFRGNFSGKGYLIRDLYINQPLQGNLGLFSNASNSEFHQIQLRNVTVLGNSNVGALIGVAVNVKVYGCSFTGKVNGKTYVGGLIGTLGNSFVSDSYSLGEVGGTKAVGGIIGNAYQTDVVRSFSTGAISSLSEAGGLIGYFQSHSKNRVENCYSLSSIQVDQVAGGIIGKMEGGQINNSYFAGHLSPSAQVSGLVGKANSSSVINNCFWDQTLSQGISSAQGKDGMTTLELKSQSFSDASAWDFEKVWAIKKPSPENPFVSYPYLRSIAYDQEGLIPPFNPIPGLENLRIPREWEFPNEKNVSYGDPDFKLGDEIDSFWYPISYSSSDTSVVKVIGNYASIKKVGVVKITAKVQDGRSAPKEQVILVQPAILKITILPNASKIYGSPDPSFAFEAVGFKNQDKLEILSGAVQRQSGEQVGAYPIHQGTLDAGSNYEIEFLDAQFIVKPRDLHVLAEKKQKSFGSQDPAYSYQVLGLVAGEDLESVLQGKPKRQPGENVGKYLIEQGDLAASANYELKFEGNSLEIVPALLISMEALSELKTAWSVAPSFPESGKFLTQEAQWVELPVQWQHQGLDYFKRGSHLIKGQIHASNYELPDGFQPEIRVTILPKAAPQDLLFEENLSQAGLVGDLKVIDSLDDHHEIRLPNGAFDNVLFEIRESKLWWSGEAKIPSKATYFLELEVEDRDGNILKKKLSLQFKSVEQQQESVEVFNSFSPNNDGINDSWMISDRVSEGQFKVVVIDGSGQVVFESHSPEKRWDGSYLGRPMPDGTYYWIFEHAGKVRRGFLNLLRGR
jgi:gliding motility-associated-like protein